MIKCKREPLLSGYLEEKNTTFHMCSTVGGELSSVRSAIVSQCLIHAVYNNQTTTIKLKDRLDLICLQRHPGRQQEAFFV